MTKKTKRHLSGVDEIGSALDLILSGYDCVVGSDFLLTRQDPFHADIGHLNPNDLNNYDPLFIDNLLTITAEKSIDIPEHLGTLYQRYKKHRQQLGEYQSALYDDMMIKYDIKSARELGNFDPYISKVVIRNDAEMSVFFDYVALYRLIKGKRLITQWNHRPKLINDLNKPVIIAYQSATFSILRLDENLQDRAIKATNIITKEECILIDKALNQSNREGCFFICSLLQMNGYSMSSEGGIILNPSSNAVKSALTLLKKHMRLLQIAKGPINIHIIECAREIYGFCLRAGLLRYMTVK